MQKEIVVAKEGFEDYFEFLKNKMETLEDEKRAEVARLVEEVDKKYEYKVEVFKTAFKSVSDVEYIEEPDEEVTEEEVEQATEEPLEG